MANSVDGNQAAILNSASPGGVPEHTGSTHVAVVGAGLAGLVAARTLKRAGIAVSLYEAGKRIGGRTHSLLDHFSPGLATELGGEFVDSRHADILALAHEFNLEILDTEAPSEQGLEPSYFFEGHPYSETDVLLEFNALAERMFADATQLSPDISAFEHSSFDQYMDQMSIAAYLDRVGAEGWIRHLLEMAYLTEFGMEVSQQSCLNLLTMLSLDTSGGFKIFGESDERYKIRGGVEQMARALSAELKAELHLEHTLVSLGGGPQGFSLEFANAGDRQTVAADFVILGIPFTVLRTIPIAVDMPAAKRLAIDTLGYGSNEKVIVGLRAPVWRELGRNGQAFSDRTFQTGWDSSRMQGAGASFSFFIGGTTGQALATADSAALAQHYVDEADALFPGLRMAFKGPSYATGWNPSPLSLGSYSCYRPGQWTTIAGWEGEPCGRLFFAGEHCSREFQGYMNGAAETGRKAAENIIGLVKGRAPC